MQKKTRATLIKMLIGLLLISIFNISIGKVEANEEITFRYGTANISGVNTFDPSIALATNEEVMMQVCEGLFSFDYYDIQRPIIPWLATGYTMLNPLTMEIDLHEDIEFHDGTDFNATAVKWNIDRLLNIVVNVSAMWRIRYYIVADPFRSLPGVDLDWVPTGAEVCLINKTTAIDEYTVRIDLNIPKELQLLENFATTTGFMISPTYYAGKFNSTYGTESLIGTGPFKLVEHSQQRMETIFIKNPEYWKGPPSITNLIFTYIEDQDTRTGALITKEIDYITNPSNLEVLGYYSSEIQIIEGRQGSYQRLIAMNSHRIPQIIRKALSFAVDYDYYLHEMQEDRSIRGGGVIPSNNPFYNKTIPIAYYNLSYAREILIESYPALSGAETWDDSQWRNFADTTPIATYVFNYPPHVADMCLLIQSSARDIGIKINMINREDAWMADQITNPELRANLDIFYTALYGVVPTDPSLVLKSYYIPNERYNMANVTDTEIETWIWEAILQDNPSEKHVILDKIANKTQNELYPYVFMSHLKSYAALLSGWTGIPPAMAIFVDVVKESGSTTSTTGENNTDISIAGFDLISFGILGISTLIVIAYLKRKEQ